MSKLIPMRGFDFDIDDIDGAEYMLDHRFEGCFCFVSGTKKCDLSNAKAILDNKIELPLASGICQMGPHRKNVVGVLMQPYLTEYDKDYLLHVERIVDEEGIEFEAAEYTIHTLPKTSMDIKYKERDMLTLEVAREGIVLLENKDNLLPLKHGEKINIFGSGFAKFRLGASGAGRINPRYSIRLLDGLEDYSSLEVNPELKSFYKTATNYLPEKNIVHCASQWSQIAVVAISRGTSENFDNLAIPGEFYLEKEEELLIEQVCKQFSKTILLLNTGYPIDVRCVKKYGVAAVLWTGLCGMQGGRAVAEILEGKVNPSGKLPDTWSYTWEEIPSSKNFFQPDCKENRISGSCDKYITTVYEEGIYVGYRYFDTFEKPVAYGFGYGLSYTSFELKWGSLLWKNPRTLDDEACEIKVVVTNTGNYPGKEVIQLYVSIPDGKLEQPKRRLVAYAKTKLLQKGESQELTLTANGRELVSFDVECATWICEPGNWKVFGGISLQESIVVDEFDIKEKMILAVSKNYMKLPEQNDITVLSKKDVIGTYPKGEKTGFTGKGYITPVVSRTYSKERNPIHYERTASKITWGMVLENPQLLKNFVGQFTDYELARTVVCAKNGWGMEEKGEAGHIYVFENYETPEFVFADGNNGVNLKKKNIGFPTSVTLCATFNEELAYFVGKAIAEEAKENDIQVILAPAANLHRNPLCGRHAEYFSEEPLLAGRMAGMQSKGLEENGAVSTLKHILANNCEASRLRNDSIIDERTLRELYMKVFEEAFFVHNPKTLMTSYNAINGIYGAENEDMLQGIFIEELGFDGFVMTDWSSSDTCNVINAIAAGNGWITPGGMEDTIPRKIVEAIKNGEINRERIEKSVYRMWSVILEFQLGVCS